ncbi:hypothetical protein ACN27F_00875 [Solwaraspora sp. WMMB335]|uniref:hypothetical protein n=1 Tax=Solwaraspora sp. WMMB335 TaxID=3404118 RepID=UPI003B932DD2
MIPTALVVVTMLSLSACAAATAKCRNNDCTVAVKTDGTVGIEILDYPVVFRDLLADTVTVEYAGVSYTIAVGQTTLVGPMSVTVTAATPGRAELRITADHRGGDAAGAASATAGAGPASAGSTAEVRVSPSR